jgi:hypothetical protein
MYFQRSVRSAWIVGVLLGAFSRDGTTGETLRGVGFTAGLAGANHQPSFCPTTTVSNNSVRAFH